MKQSVSKWFIAIGSLTLVLAACTPPASKGFIKVTASGVPTGQTATVTINKADNTQADSLSLGNETKTSKELDAATYSVSAGDIVAGGFTYKPTLNPTSPKVEAGKTTDVALSYAASDGRLTVTISGLPTGTNGNVTVAKQGGGFNQVLTATTTLSSLVPGTYTITPADVTAGGFTYKAATSNVNVTAGATATATANYGASAGKLTVTISGLPAGVDGSVQVAKEGGGFNQAITATTTLENLAPGSYTITPANVSASGTTYSAATSNVNVTAGATATAAVNYSAATGNLQVGVTGLPAGASAVINVAGPNGYTNNLSTGQTISNLVPGSYTVSANSVVSGGITYTANINGSPATVAAGATANVTVTYTASTGKLSITTTGLPTGANPNISVTGPSGFNQSVSTATITFDNLAPGSYTVSASNVVANTFTYTGTPSGSPATVAAGATANVSVVYAASNGNLQINLSGLPATVGTTVTVSNTSPVFNQAVVFNAGETSKTILAPAGSGYTVVPNNVTKSGTIVDEYHTPGAVAPATVTAATLTTVNVTYSKRAGTGQMWIAATIPDTAEGVFGYNESLLVTGTPTPTFSLLSSGLDFDKPLGVAFDKQGNLYVANQNNQAPPGKLYTIVRVTAASLQANNPEVDLIIQSKAIVGGDPSAHTIENPEYLAFDPQGNLWVGNSNGLVRFDSTTLALNGTQTPDPGRVLWSSTISSFDNIAGLAMSGAGDLFISNYLGNLVTKVPAALASASGVTNVVQNQVNQISALFGPTGLAFDSSGGLWVVEQLASYGAPAVLRGQITKVGNGFAAEQEGVVRSVEVRSTALLQPNAIAFDNGGKLWVTNQNCVNDTGTLCTAQFPGGNTVGKVVQLNATAGDQNSPAVVINRTGSLTGIAFNLHPSGLPLNGRP